MKMLTQQAMIRVSLAIVAVIIMYFVWTKLISPRSDSYAEDAGEYGEYVPMDGESFEDSPGEFEYAPLGEGYDDEDTTPETYDEDTSEMYEDTPEMYEDTPETYDEDTPETYDEDTPETYDEDTPEMYDEDTPEMYDEDTPETYQQEMYDDGTEDVSGQEPYEEGVELEAYDDSAEHEMYDDDGEMYDDMNEGFSVMEPTVDDAYANALFTAPVM